MEYNQNNCLKNKAHLKMFFEIIAPLQIWPLITGNNIFTTFSPNGKKISAFFKFLEFNSWDSNRQQSEWFRFDREQTTNKYQKINKQNNQEPQHIESWIKWPIFCGGHFQMLFLERNFLNQIHWNLFSKVPVDKWSSLFMLTNIYDAIKWNTDVILIEKWIQLAMWHHQATQS